MRLSKTRKHHTVDVDFLIDDNEANLKLLVQCMTPRQMAVYMGDIEKVRNDYTGAIEANCGVVCGWEGVVDEEGNEVSFSKEKLRDVQLDYTGLSDAIFISISRTYQDLREKNLGKSSNKFAE